MDINRAFEILLEGYSLSDLLDYYGCDKEFFSKENIELLISMGYEMSDRDYLFIISNLDFDVWLIDMYFNQYGDIDIPTDACDGNFTIIDCLVEATHDAEREQNMEKKKKLKRMTEYALSLRK